MIQNRVSISRGLFHSVIPALLALILFAPMARRAAADVNVYGDALAAGWEDWSWGTTVNFSSTAKVFSGSKSISVQYTRGWAGLYLHAPSALQGSDVTALRFQVHGGTSGGQQVRVQLYDGAGTAVGAGVTISPSANAWQAVNLTIASLGSPATIGGIVWQEGAGATPPAFYLDDIVLVGGGGSTGGGTTSVSLSVNAGAGRHAISPLIYGMNFTDEALARELRLPVRRWGGNATTRYNWKNDTANHAADWYFENIPNDNANVAALPDGSSSDLFVEQDRRTWTKTIMTAPLIGWTPKSRAKAGGFSVAKYGAQQDTDPWLPDAGNGVRPDGSKITGNDPADTSLAITPTFVSDWVKHLVGRYGTAAQGGVAFYNLDNEPMLWNDTHRDVHPTPTSYDELRDRTYAYAAAIKSADPGAATLGPVLWGWTAYFWSAKDAAAGGAFWNNPPDRNAHGGTSFVEWYLQQMRAYEQTNKVRILDYLDLHYYPQAAGVSLAGAGDANTQALRLRSTRGLWDASYTDESWIGEPVRLIPRMREWVNANYPGTKLAVTEYNWGALDHINGALAQADALGIFGREGLDLATLWDPPKAAQPGAYAFRMYRNYDGAGGAFGDVAVQAASGDQSKLAIYAAQRSADRALTLMIINKTAGSITGQLALSGYTPAASGTVFRYGAANLAGIVRSTVSVGVGGFQATYPANSITLVVLRPGTTASRSWTMYAGQ